MASAAYNASVKVTGTSTAFTGEACTNTTGKTYQLNDTTKRIIDPDTTPTVYDNAVPVSAANIDSFDYLNGKVTFDSGYTIVGAITMDGQYLPTWTLASCREFSVDMSVEMLDSTVFHSSNSHHTFVPGLLSWSGTMGSLDTGNTDMDTGGTSLTIHEMLTNASLLVIEYTPPGSSTIWKFFALVSSEQFAGAVDGLHQTTINWQGSGKEAADGATVGMYIA